MPRLFLFLSIIILTPFLSAATYGASTNTTASVTDSAYKSAGERSISRILILHSYNFGFIWTDNISEGINSVLEDYKDEIEIIYEFLDSRRIYSDDYFQELRDLYNLKYANRPIDIVICSDDHALNFVVKYDMFRKTPIVFCSVTGFDPAVRQKREITGLEEALSIEETLEIALKQNPETRNITVVNAQTLTGQSLKKKAAPIFDKNENLSFDYVDTLTIEELTTHVSDLPADHIIFLFIFNQDQSGRAFSHERNLEILREHSSVPIYSVWGFYLGHGIVGGKLASGRAEGEMVAEMALRILHGEKASEIPIRMSPTQYMFDYYELQHWNIRQSSLPDGSFIINQPSSFYHQHKNLIWGISGLFMLLIVFVVVLLINIGRRKRTEAALRESEERFKLAMEASQDGLWDWNVATDEAYYSPGYLSMLGYEIEELPGHVNSWKSLLHPEDKEQALGITMGCVENHCDDFEIEFRMKAKDGKWCWILGRGRAVSRDKNGRATRMVGTITDITRRKVAQEQLEKSKETAEKYLDIAAEIILSLDRQGNITLLNESGHTTLGYQNGELIGKNWFDTCIPEPKRPEIEKIFSKLMDGKIIEAGSAENLVRTENGGLKTILWHNTILRDESGAIVGTLSSGQDITEAKKAEEALQKSEQKHRVFLENFNGIAYQTSNDSITPLFVYGTVEEITGYTIEDFLSGRVKWDELVYEEDLEKVLEKTKDLKSTPGFMADSNYRIRTREGELRWIRDIARSVTSESGEVSFIQGAVYDINERKRAADLLIESERRYQELFSSVIEGIAVIDENETIRFVNPSLINIFGEDSENAMLGKNIFDYFPEDQKSLIARLSGKSRAGKTSQYESEILAADGKPKNLFVSITPRFDMDGKYSGAFCTVLDITENTRLRELESRAERLETAATIAGQVAHDFNNLLAPLMAYPEFIRDELPGGNPALEFIDDIENAAKKISEINQDLLTMGRRVHYNQQIIDLNKVVLQTAREMESMRDGFRIETDLCENLMRIKGGASQIHRALTNLLTNARDATHKKGKAVIKTENYYSDDSMIALSRVPKGEYVRLTIFDNGTGIHPDIIEKIFDPFFSTKTADRKRGTGLGLSVVEAVVKDHHGHIDIKSKVGEGTSFFLYFPITREEAPESLPEELKGGRESILIIDDDEIQRNVTSRLLKNLGYDIYTAASGERAVEFLKEKQCDLLILDMVMPDGIDGTETYRQILQINPNQKAIIVSGFSMSNRVREAQRLGAGEFVQKPITRKKIASAVRNELDSRVKASSS